MKKLLITLLFICISSFVYGQNQDCIDATDVCATTAFVGNSNGSGSNDFSDPDNNDGCLLGENQSAWYRINVIADGTLEFIITPDGSSDYDFALYESDDCGDLGSPIRCSYAATCDVEQQRLFGVWFTTGVSNCNYQTGLQSSQTQTSESGFSGVIGSGSSRTLISNDGFVDTVNVIAGQTYYLLIDNFSADLLGYTIDFSSTTANLSCTLLPLMFGKIDIAQTAHSTALIDWTTYSEYNVEAFYIEKKTSNNIETIGFINALNKEINDYQYYDFSFNEEAYYRIVLVNYDGTKQSSNWVYLPFNTGRRDYKVIPNPVNNILVTPNTDHTISNSAGQIMYEGNEEQNLDISNYPQGVYYINTINKTYKFLKK